MKRKCGLNYSIRFICMIIIILMGLLAITGSGGGGSEGSTESPESQDNQTPSSSSESIETDSEGSDTSVTSGSDKPEYEGTWYAYTENVFGFHEVKMKTTFNGSNFEHLFMGKMSTEWYTFMGFRGTFIDNGDDTLSMTFAEIFSSTDETWQGEGGSMYEDALKHLLGGSTECEAECIVSSNSLTLKEDMDNNGDYTGDFENITYSNTENDDAYVTGHGIYPPVGYAGLGFHDDPTTASLSVEINDIFNLLADVETVAIDLKNSNDSHTNILLAYDSDEEEWGGNYDMDSYPETGLWWISKIVVNLADGSSSTYNTSSPYNETYTLDIITSSGYNKSNMPLDTSKPDFIPQDYVWPQSSDLYYIETFLNGSSADTRTDTGLKVFHSSDTTNWIAFNDDGARDSLSAGLRVPLNAGDTYYISVADIFYHGGAYSIKITSTGFNGSSTQTVADPDSYEPDNNYQQATTIMLDQVQDHSLSVGDEDWFVFMVPEGHF